MATTTGAAGARRARLTPPFPGVNAAGMAPARGRLLSLVDMVGAYVWGRHPVVRPLSRSEPSPMGGSDLDRSEYVPYPAPAPAPARPAPADKPTTLAHYQAMADQVAHERRLSELDARLVVGVAHDGVGRDAWCPSVTGGRFDGGRRG